jgi:hypothetical protein
MTRKLARTDSRSAWLHPCGGREQLSGPADGSRAGPAVIGIYVDVAAADDGDHAPVGEAVTVFEDRRDHQLGPPS